jgi:hypothetical protein
MIDFSLIAIGICVVCAVVTISLFVAIRYDSNTRSMPENKDDDDDKKVDLNKED